jgi:transposase InsO family protein
MMKLLEFEYAVEYKKGTSNRAADALSRQHGSIYAISVVQPKWLQDIADSYAADLVTRVLVQQYTIQAPNTTTHHTFQQGILRYKGRIMIGNNTELKDKIFLALHASAVGGHSGMRATYQRIKRLFHWPGLKQWVETKVATCPICQRSKHENCKYPGLLDPLPTPDMAWTHISMDFIDGLPKSNGKEVILVVVDRLTKFAHFIPLAHPYTVQTVAQAFIDNVLKLHGPPIAIVSDHDRIFTSHMWKSIFSALKVDLRYSSAYHPMSDGQMERVNKCIETYLRCMTFAEPKKWLSWLSLAEFWYNTTYHNSLNTTPF